jgi:glucoamylase
MSGAVRKSTVVVAAGILLSGVVQTAAAGASPAAPLAPVTQALGAPGTLSHFDEARKDCVGTARNTASKIWFTVANGVLSDVYAPTVDTTNVETMQYIVTDGSTFTDLQSRDTTYTASSDGTGMVCAIVSTSASHGYQLRTVYTTDVSRTSVIVHTTYVPLTHAARSYKLYVRLDATAAGNGGGGTGNGGADSATTDTSTGHSVPVTFDTNTSTNAVNRDYAVPTYLALVADRSFASVSSGFVGTASDALLQLDATHAMSPTYTDATAGNVEQTAQVRLDSDRQTTLALGFGTTQHAAVMTAAASADQNYFRAVQSYVEQWLRYDRGLRRPAEHLSGLSHAQVAHAAAAYYVSANVVKASEDKTFPGAIAASLTSPWGQAVSAGDPNNTYFGSYREIFARDLYEAWTALLTDGDLSTARDAVRFLFLHQQQPDGSMPRNSLVNGKVAPDSFNTQLDEAAYPILMAQQSGLGNDATLWPHIQAAANFLVSHGPATGPERWEEQSGYSPSTIAAEIAGLVAAGALAKQHNDANSAQVYLATADLYQRSIKGWAVTTNGPLSTSPYFIRLSKTGDPNAAISYNVGNGGPTLDQRTVIDAGFLELIRLGELSPSDADVANSLKVVDATISRTTVNGTGWLRYNGDGYGDCYEPEPLTGCPLTGRPWAPSNQGTGHIWPVLSAERAEQSLATGDPMTAAGLLVSMGKLAGGVGLVPEQDWDFPDVAASPFGTDPTVASIGFVNGKPSGSATPLTWGSASEVRLAADLAAGKVVEKPTSTTDRYLNHTQGATTLTVTAPADNSAATGTVAVTGTTAPNAKVVIADVATDQNDATTLFTTTALPDGSFSVPVLMAAGSNVLVITAMTASGATAQVVRNLVNDVVNGTLLLNAADPSGDDNGPGNYAYPTAADFHPGAYDLQQFQVYDTGSTVTFRVQTRDLSPTFGSPEGAQLVDVYVHDPAAGTTSTAASFAARNYSIASADAWSRLIEVQGFGQRFIDASSPATTVGTVTIKANAISRFITFSVDKTALGGTPASGWGFAVALTGQDGFSPDQARGFQPLPQAFQFGVCAVVSVDPHCTFNPNNVPKVIDTITPTGVNQSTELDYTLGPVVLQGVRIP